MLVRGMYFTCLYDGDWGRVIKMSAELVGMADKKNGALKN